MPAYSNFDDDWMFEVYAWTRSLTEDCLALGRVEDALARQASPGPTTGGPRCRAPEQPAGKYWRS